MIVGIHRTDRQPYEVSIKTNKMLYAANKLVTAPHMIFCYPGYLKGMNRMLSCIHFVTMIEPDKYSINKMMSP